MDDSLARFPLGAPQRVLQAHGASDPKCAAWIKPHLRQRLDALTFKPVNGGAITTTADGMLSFYLPAAASVLDDMRIGDVSDAPINREAAPQDDASERLEDVLDILTSPLQVGDLVAYQLREGYKYHRALARVTEVRSAFGSSGEQQFLHEWLDPALETRRSKTTWRMRSKYHLVQREGRNVVLPQPGVEVERLTRTLNATCAQVGQPA